MIDADEIALLVDDSDDAEPLGRHFDDRVVHRAARPASAGARRRECISRLTGFSRAPSDPPGCSRPKSVRVKPFCRMTVIASASPSASVIVVEVVGATDSGPTSGQCGRIKEPRPLLPSIECSVAGDRDDRNPDALEMIDHRLELGGLAALRNQDRDVAFRGHSEVAVDRFRKMKESRGRAGRCEGRGDLARDMARLAEAR